MAGEFPGGGAQRFRDAISFVQEMAAAPLDAEQVHFFFPNELVYYTPWLALPINYYPGTIVEAGGSLYRATNFINQSLEGWQLTSARDPNSLDYQYTSDGWVDFGYGSPGGPKVGKKTEGIDQWGNAPQLVLMPNTTWGGRFTFNGGVGGQSSDLQTVVQPYRITARVVVAGEMVTVKTLDIPSSGINGQSFVMELDYPHWADQGNGNLEPWWWYEINIEALTDPAHGVVRIYEGSMVEAVPPWEAENWEVVSDSNQPLMAPDGRSYNPQLPVLRQRPPAQRVPCSVTYFDRMGEITNIGVVTPTRIALDLLDEHWEKVKDFEFVVIAGDKYVRRRVEPPSGLFDVGIYTVHCDAENET